MKPLPKSRCSHVGDRKGSLQQVLLKMPHDQADAFTDYCKKHDVSKAVAGRIAFARLRASKPTEEEIKTATLTLGKIENLVQYRRQKED